MEKKPDWLRVRLPGGERYQRLKETFRRLDLHTVCEEARCPNVGECWGEGTATLMILGETCTRGCRFCAVNTGDPGGAVAHNVEVVPELQRTMRDARCSWNRSVDVLRWAKDEGANVTKTSLMVGCGETEAQVLDAMRALRAADVDVLTVGQYLRPSPKHAEVKRFVEPAEFDRYRDAGLEMGFRFVASGPLVRSSYRAAEAFLQGILKGISHVPFEDRYGKKTRLAVLP